MSSDMTLKKKSAYMQFYKYVLLNVFPMIYLTTHKSPVNQVCALLPFSHISKKKQGSVFFQVCLSHFGSRGCRLVPMRICRFISMYLCPFKKTDIQKQVSKFSTFTLLESWQAPFLKLSPENLHPKVHGGLGSQASLQGSRPASWINFEATGGVPPWGSAERKVSKDIPASPHAWQGTQWALPLCSNTQADFLIKPCKRKIVVSVIRKCQTFPKNHLLGNTFFEALVGLKKAYTVILQHFRKTLQSHLLLLGSYCSQWNVAVK